MININNLFVEYERDTPILTDISFDIDKDKSVAILGSNGAGKTTILHSIVGLIDPSGGEIIVDNLSVKKENMLEIRQRTGLIFQNPDDQLFMPTVLDDVSFAPVNDKMSVQDAEKASEEVLERFNLLELKDSSPLRLSGGEKRLVAIAGILITNPKVILFDEPTAYLDYPAKKMLIKIINELNLTKIIASHDIRFCKEVCNRAIILKEGKIILDIPIEELENNKDILEDCGIDPS